MSQEVDSILALIRDNQWAFSIAGTSISFFAGWYIAKHRFDSEAIKAHFQELKAHVVEPLLVYLKEDDLIVPSIQEVKENSLELPYWPKGMDEAIKYKVDSILLDDLLMNHYPFLRKEWENLYDVAQKEKKVRVNLESMIIERLRSDSERRGMKYQLQGTSQEPDKLDLGLLVSALRKSLQQKRYNQDLARFDYDRKLILFDADDTVGLYSFAQANNYGEVLVNIKSMCTDVASVPEIVQLAKEYDLIANNFAKKRMKFISDLGIIYRRTNLKLEKRAAKIKCVFVKTR